MSPKVALNGRPIRVSGRQLSGETGHGNFGWRGGS